MKHIIVFNIKAIEGDPDHVNIRTHHIDGKHMNVCKHVSDVYNYMLRCDRCLPGFDVVFTIGEDPIQYRPMSKDFENKLP